MLKIRGIDDIASMSKTMDENEYNPHTLKEQLVHILNTEVTIERNGDDVIVRRLLRD